MEELMTFWTFLNNSSLASSFLANGISELLKGLIGKWKSNKSDRETPLTLEDLKRVLDEYGDEERKTMVGEIKKLNGSPRVVQINQNNGGNNAQTIYGNINFN